MIHAARVRDIIVRDEARLVVDFVSDDGRSQWCAILPQLSRAMPLDRAARQIADWALAQEAQYRQRTRAWTA